MYSHTNLTAKDTLVHNIRYTVADITSNHISPIAFNDAFIKGFSQTQAPERYYELIYQIYSLGNKNSFLATAVRTCYPAVLKAIAVEKPEQCAQLVLRSLILDQYSTIDKTCDFLSSHFHFCSCAIALLKLTSGTEQKLLFDKLVDFSISKYNAVLAIALEKFHPGWFQEKLQQNLAYANQFESINCSKISFEELTRYMQQFTNGFGNIDYEGGLVSCAQIHEQKARRPRGAYEFAPTILKGDNDENSSNKTNTEFDTYLKIIRDSDILPLRERFLIAENHWFAGEIEIDITGKARLLIIDSLGEKSFAFPTHLITYFANTFPEGEIYFSSEKRQNSGAGCSVFSIDDMVHLHTLEAYLDKKFSDTGIFGYITSQADLKKLDTPELGNITVMGCKIPITLLRTTQSKKILSEIFPSRHYLEQDSIINKKGENAVESTKAAFIEGKNLRIDNKLTRLAEKNVSYLLSVSPEELQAQKNKFTLAGFGERLQDTYKMDEREQRLQNFESR